MIRRRRRVREIPFSFDSFLDIVANVVGIIIRLILVVWVGARSYSSLQVAAIKPPPRPAKVIPTVEEVSDPLKAELARHSRELAQAQEHLLAELRRLQEVTAGETETRNQLLALNARHQQLSGDLQNIEQSARVGADAVRAAALSSTELRRRIQKLALEIHALEQLPPPKKTLHYRTPVSRPVDSEELLFECNNNRVTFIDITALLNEVRDGIEDKGKLLRTQWQVSDVAGPVGPFRLRYTVERERSLFDAVAGQAVPETNGGFRYGLSDWQVEPILPVRGETADAALAEGSEFRQIVDRIDPQQTVVTFWVYPDSFALYRRLRDFLYERDVVVAGRPLPKGMPIASSRRGSVSRGQ
jgi:Skp family chaperone for outer membrane proteins